MEQYIVTGMSCAACQARVEKAVGNVPGVTSCAVSLLTNSMAVEGTAREADIIKAVTDAGYGASRKGTSRSADTSNDAEALEDHESPVLARRLIFSIIFLLILMYISMGHMMWGWPVPGFMAENHVALALVEFILSVVIMLINYKFFTSGFRSLMHGAPNMDTLVALGSAASLGYSIVELFIMVIAMGNHDHETVMKYAHNLYFESAAMIPCLITVGKLLEAISKGRTTDALKSLMKLAPQTAFIERDGIVTEVAISEVQNGDIFVVKPGDSIPVDGIVTEGSSAVNEAALTGESIPVDKEIGDLISAATINQSGFLKARATRVGEDTTLAKIIQMVQDASTTKAEIARIADKVSGIFVPAVIAIALFTLAVWLIAGQTFSFSIARAIAVLVISCPCALGLATPVAIMVGNGVGAKNGILFKTAVALEKAGKINIIALDKTGTVTSGMPEVTDIIPVNGSEEDLLRLAVSIEQPSEHPLARAVVEYGMKKGTEVLHVDNFRALSGNGIEGTINTDKIVAGSFKYINSIIKLDKNVQKTVESLSNQGKTPLLFTENGELKGIIAVADTIKETSYDAVRQLRNMGIQVVMLTGDNRLTARAIGEKAGIDKVVSGVLPDGKEAVIRNLQKSGTVAMVGDGINDAPALTAADLGIAIGSGTDVAVDSADVVLMKSDLLDVAGAIRLSRYTVKNIHENLFWAFFYNVICIPLAAGFYQKLFGVSWEMSPMIGAAAMSISSFTVCMNALRINLFDINDPSKDKKIKEVEIEIKEEEEKMIKTITVEGMMCEHCQATVKKALEKIDGVEKADVSFETGLAIVTLNKDVDNAVLKEAIEDRDYGVLGIE